MKTLKVPYLNISTDDYFIAIAKLLSSGIKEKIDQINWPDAFPKSFPVSVSVGHNRKGLFIYFSVRGERVRAVNTKDFGSVWEDSCVEFFMQRENEKVYRNFECNILGTLLASQRESKENAENLLAEEMKSIGRYTTISHRYEEEKEVCDWTALLVIPKETMGFSSSENLSEQKIRANFYKCGDKTLEPHFLSWNRIDSSEPNFHLPQYFGLLELE